MASAYDAVEKAAYTLLSAGGDIGAPVYQHVPENTDPPVIIIGDMTSVALAPKGDGDERITLTIVAAVNGEERKPLLALLNGIKERLHNARVAVGDDWELAFTWLSGNALITPDGEGYIGDSQFEVLALRTE